MQWPFLNWSLIAFGLVSLARMGMQFLVGGKIVIDVIACLLILAGATMKTPTGMKVALVLQTLDLLWFLAWVTLGGLEALGLPIKSGILKGGLGWEMALPYLGWSILNVFGLLRSLKQKPTECAAS